MLLCIRRLVPLHPVYAFGILLCRITNFDKELGQYDLNYACGYSTSVSLTDMSTMMEAHQGWDRSKNPRIRELFNDAEQDWNNFNSSESLNEKEVAGEDEDDNEDEDEDDN